MKPRSWFAVAVITMVGWFYYAPQPCLYIGLPGLACIAVIALAVHVVQLGLSGFVRKLALAGLAFAEARDRQAETLRKQHLGRLQELAAAGIEIGAGA